MSSGLGSGKEADFSDPALQAALDKIKHKDSKENFVCYGFEGKTSKAVLVATGEGGLADLVKSLDETRVQFAVLRIVGEDIQETVTSYREKFIVFNWLGSKVSVLLKGKVVFQSKIFATWLKGLSVTAFLDVSKLDDYNLTMEGISAYLLKAGGAHKPTKYVYGPGQEYDLKPLLGAAAPSKGYFSPSVPKTDEKKT